MIPRETLIAQKLTAFLQENVQEGQDAEVAVHPEREMILVFIGGEMVLNCTFEQMLGRIDN